jgi:hypothetical protein
MQVSDTRFNYRRGFYSESIQVLIQSATPGSRIRYTLDGTAPTPDSGLGNTNPVVIPIDATTVLRAVAYKEGMFPSNVDTQTYIFVDDVIRQPALVPGYPNPELRTGYRDAVPLDYEMDPEIVNDLRYHRALKAGLLSIPTLSIVMDKDDLFSQALFPGSSQRDLKKSGVYWGFSGIGSTRPASAELINPEHPERDFQEEVGLEGHSWDMLKRPLKLKFKKEYGSGKLRSSIFKHAPLNGETAAELFDRIVLRSGKNRSWATAFNRYAACYTRDQWARDSQIAMSGIGSHGTFVHLYLNGLYWGLYNACERPDTWFASAYLGGQPEDWFCVKETGPFQGDATRWKYLTEVLVKKDMRIPNNYQELRRYLDVQQFSDYLILSWYMGMKDWPQKNWYAVNRNHPPSPILFFVWDAEESWTTDPDVPRLRGAPSGWVHPRFRRQADARSADMVGIWHSVRKNDDFMSLFADRVYGHCYNDGPLTDGNAVARWRTLNDYIEDAVVGESARWGDARELLGESTRTRDATFYPEIERVEQLMKGNVEAFIRALRRESYYPEADPPEIEINRPLMGEATVKITSGFGTIYYTSTGEDPRAPGGAVASRAIKAVGYATIVPKGTGIVKARAKIDNTWSALVHAKFP